MFINASSGSTKSLPIKRRIYGTAFHNCLHFIGFKNRASLALTAIRVPCEIQLGSRPDYVKLELVPANMMLHIISKKHLM